jgi:uncharacterized protein YneF (UPF0154 family)
VRGLKKEDVACLLFFLVGLLIGLLIGYFIIS